MNKNCSSGQGNDKTLYVPVRIIDGLIQMIWTLNQRHAK